MFEKNIRLEFDLELTMNNLNILVKKTFHHQEKILGTGGGHRIRVFCHILFLLCILWLKMYIQLCET